MAKGFQRVVDKRRSSLVAKASRMEPQDEEEVSR